MIRDVTGFLVGGFVAATVAGLVFSLVYPPLPESDPSRHDRGAALVILALVMLFSGGLIGSKGFSADFLSDLLWPIIGSYVAVGFLCLLASFSLGETATMVAFATAGIVSSVVVSLVLLRLFPMRQEG